MFTSVSLKSMNVPQCRDLGAPEVKPKLKWDWISQLQLSPSMPRYESFSQVMAAPMVADVDGDQKPEVVFVSFSINSADWFPDSTSSSYRRNGVLRVVDGATGFTKFSVGDIDRAPMGVQSPLLMDIDGDGKAEIFYLNYLSNAVVALNGDGSLRWKFMLPAPISFTAAGLTGGDVDGDGIGDILAGATMISENSAHQPVVKYTLAEAITAQAGVLMMPLDPSVPNRSSLVNIYGLWDRNGRKIAAFPSGLSYFAAADLFPEIPGLEIVGTGSGRLTILNGLTGAVIRDVDLKMYNNLLCPSGSVGGGPPSVGDFDGDPATLEIAVATGRHLTLFDRDGVPKYKTVTQDCSSLATGLTSFDLNGDKKPEVLYADEEYFRIFEVRNGVLTVVHKLVNPSGTLQEYPVVADIDGNGTASIVLAANNYAAGGFYKDPDELADAATALGITGVRAFESTSQQAWMPTRPVWNQHSFHPDLVTDAARFLTAPLIDSAFFRRNNQGYNLTLKCTP